jgi:hypothetical protein
VPNPFLGLWFGPAFLLPRLHRFETLVQHLPDGFIMRGIRTGIDAQPCRNWQQSHLDLAWWLKLQTYAATADAWSGVSCAPPIGGIGLRYFFGCETPSTIVFLMLP